MLHENLTMKKWHTTYITYINRIFTIKTICAFKNRITYCLDNILLLQILGLGQIMT